MTGSAQKIGSQPENSKVLKRHDIFSLAGSNRGNEILFQDR